MNSIMLQTCVSLLKTMLARLLQMPNKWRVPDKKIFNFEKKGKNWSSHPCGTVASNTHAYKVSVPITRNPMYCMSCYKWVVISCRVTRNLNRIPTWRYQSPVFRDCKCPISSCRVYPTRNYHLLTVATCKQAILPGRGIRAVNFS